MITFKLIREFEKSIVENLSKEDLLYWPILKSKLSRKANLQGVTDYSISRFGFKDLIYLILSVFNYSVACITRRKQTYAVFGALSRVRVSGDVLVDELISPDILKDSFKFYHNSGDVSVSLPLFISERIVFENYLVKILILIYRGLLIFDFRKTTSENSKLPLIEFALTYFSSDIVRSELDTMMEQFHLSKRAYAFLLSNLKFDSIYIVSAYTKHPIVNVAHDLFKEVKEVQHGVLSPFHICYDYSIFKGKKELKGSILLPDEIIVDNSFWFKNIENSGYALDVSIKLEGTEKELRSETNNIIYTDKYFLITGQGICYQEMSEFIMEILSFFPDIMVYYRPHPRELSVLDNLIGIVSHSNFRVIGRFDEPDTENLIFQSAAHFSIFSSCHFYAIECLEMTYVLDWIPNNLMEIVKGKNYVTFVKDANEFKKKYENSSRCNS